MQFVGFYSFIVIIFAGFFSHIEASKILSVFPYPGPSQYIFVQPYLKALAARGHEVTTISAFPQKQPIKNFRDIPALAIHDNYNDFIKDFVGVHNKWQQLNMITSFVTNVSLRILENERVQDLMNSNEKFDLVIIETMLCDALYGLGPHFNAPLIGISTFGTDPHIDELVGNISPLSYTPLVTSDLPERMNFYERLQNCFVSLLESVHVHTVNLPSQKTIYKKYFPYINIELEDLRKQFSLILLNQHFSLSYSRPYVPNMIEVGGLHISHTPSPLPTDMETFINGSKHGVIYFSMGSNIKSKDLPQDKREIILKTFAKLPQRVLWKFEDTNLPGKPDNVFISKWFPQPDVLSHPNVILFITHGGLLSTIESIYHAKPVLGIPMVFDQNLNVERAITAGFGLRQDFSTMNIESFTTNIIEVIENQKYMKTAQEISKRYRDQPMAPLDKAIWWTEHVLRHNGALYMRNPGQDLNFIQLHNLDVIALVLGSFSLIIITIVWIIVKLRKFVFGANIKQKRKQH